MMKKINLGAGKLIKSGKCWDNLDIHDKFGANIILDLNFPLQIKDESYDYVLAHHVLEHLNDTMHRLDDWFRILKKGGKLEIEVPYGNAVWNSIDHKREFRWTTFASYCEHGDDDRKYDVELIKYRFVTRQTKFRRKLKCFILNRILQINPKLIDYTILKYFTDYIFINVIYKKK